MIKVDQSAMKSIKIKVKPNIDIDRHKISHQYEVREGLYVQPMKEVKQERIIKLSWVPADVTDKQIIDVHQLFGKVTKPPVDSRFVIKDSAPSL